ncbi:MAG: TrkA family potassium uptake protein [Ilumatobacteraceae bacterium]
MADKKFSKMLSGLRPPVEHRGEIVVIGLGRFGSSLASTLIDMGHEVLGLDADAERVQQHAGLLTHVAQADTTSEQTLRQLGVGDAVTAVVAIGADVEASVLTTGALVDLEVPNIWAKALTKSHGRILERVGAHHVVFPEADMGARVARLVTGALIEYFALDDDFVLVETRVPRNLAGMKLGDTDLRATYKVTVVCIKPEGQAFTYAESATLLGEHDLIVVAGHRGDIERFADVET